MSKWFRWVLLVAIIIVAGTIYYFYGTGDRNITDFESCAKKYPVMETYPAQCRTSDGRTFTEPTPIPSTAASSSGATLQLSSAWQVCETDSDCVETQPDCCGCSNGGTQVGINKKYLAAWQSEIAKACQDIGCPAVYVCTEGKISCNSNKVCEFKRNQ